MPSKPLLTLFQVFLKSAHWPSRLGLPQGRNRSRPAGRSSGRNSFLFRPIDYPRCSRDVPLPGAAPAGRGNHEQERDIVRLAVLAAPPCMSGAGWRQSRRDRCCGELKARSHPVANLREKTTPSQTPRSPEAGCAYNPRSRGGRSAGLRSASPPLRRSASPSAVRTYG